MKLIVYDCMTRSALFDLHFNKPHGLNQLAHTVGTPNLIDATLGSKFCTLVAMKGLEV